MKKILLYANHENGYNITKHLINRKDANIVLLVVLSDTKNQWWKSVKQLAHKNKLNYLVYKNEDQIVKKLKNQKVDILISANWRSKISDELLAIPKIGAVNFHNSLLPKYRGAYANAWAIEKGEKETGTTLHWMTKNFDDGKIIAQKKVPIYPADTAREVWERINQASLDLFKKYWPKINSWKRISKKQSGRSSYFSKKDYSTSNEIKLNRKVTAIKLINKIRARTFSPYYQDSYIKDPKTGKKIFLSVNLKQE